jgi:hypothetical protein
VVVRDDIARRCGHLGAAGTGDNYHLGCDFFLDPVCGGRVPRYNPVVRFIERIANAVLDPFRQLQDRVLRSAGAKPLPIDFSPLLAIVVIQLLIGLLNGLR